MGLIKAGIGALGGTLADQWKEFFYCEALPKNVLMVKGQKQITSRSSNTKGNDNIISNGSGIAVADGQCMMIVEQGKVVEVSPKEKKVIVENINMVTKHVKPRQMGQQGGIVKCEAPLYASKVMVVCPKCGKPTRVGHKIEADGTKSRVCKNADCGKTY